ncbi:MULTISPECIES: hypothetical protein [Fructobacillus]|uniref:Uncharacterized protein n=1 Tax=Fructobacillus papyrifericola TaxID=2713172 RepID=A0ABS5QT75_9LACO|nr:MULTISPECIES: hypothetical protein [Fructobacillus]MBS9336400.1 hypothetical protein [Fructobacillus papyrifericola]MCK8639025.1 hypothetical protein [Fructobacillus fructosus]
MEKKWYFKYDPQTFEFIPGAILAEEQPENTTDIEPTGFYGLPKWNPSTNSWTGQSIGDYLAEQKANAKQQLDPQQQQLNTIANQLLKQNIALSQRVSALEREAK